MNRLLLLSLFAFTFLPSVLLAEDEAGPLPVAELERNDPVDFAKELFPVLRKNCLPCHNTSKSKGKLNMETVALIKQGAGGDPVLVPGKPEDSLLFLTAAHIDEPMPPEGNKAKARNLNPTELALLKRWIEEGAQGEVTDAADAPVVWISLATNVTPIYAAAISSDSQFAACGRGNDLHIYNLHSGRAEQTVADAHRDVVQSVAGGPDGQFATGGFRSLTIWQRSVDTRLREWQMTAPVTTLAATSISNQLWLAAGDEKGHIAMWSAAAGATPAATATPKHHKLGNAAITGLGFSAEGSVVSAADKALRIAERNNQEQSLRQLPHPPGALALSAGYAFVPGPGNTIIGHELGGTNQFELGKMNAPAVRLVIHEGTLAAADEKGQFKIFDLAAKKERRAFNGKGPARSISLNADHLLAATESGAHLFQTKDGKHLASAATAPESSARQAQLTRQLALAERLLKHRKTKRDAAVKKRDDDAKKLTEAGTKLTQAVAGLRKQEQTWKRDTRTRDQAAALAKRLEADKAPTLKAAQDALKRAEDAWKKTDAATVTSRDAERAARLNRDAALRLAQRASEAALKTELLLTEATERKTQISAGIEENKKAIETAKPTVAKVSAALLQNGTILSAAADGFRTHSMAGKALGASAAAESPVRVMLPLADGTTLIGLENNRVAQVDLRPRWTASRTITGLVDRVSAIAFTPDGRHVALGCGIPSRDGRLQLHDTATGDLVWEKPEAHTDSLTGIAIAPDGQSVASASADRYIRTWNIHTGELIHEFEGHTAFVLDVAWSADGLTLVSGGADKVVKLWDAETGKQKASHAGFGHEVTAVDFLGDAEQFVCAAGDKTVRIGKDGRLPEVKDFMYACAASPDGAFIVAGGQDSVFRVWSKDKKLLHALK